MDLVPWVTFDGSAVKRSGNTPPKRDEICQDVVDVVQRLSSGTMDNGGVEKVRIIDKSKDSCTLCEDQCKESNYSKAPPTLHSYWVQFDRKCQDVESGPNNHQSKPSWEYFEDNSQENIKLGFVADHPPKTLLCENKVGRCGKEIVEEAKRLSTPMKFHEYLASNMRIQDSCGAIVSGFPFDSPILFTSNSKPTAMNDVDVSVLIADNDFDSESNFSDEVCDLNLIDNDNLLKDTRKQFPDELLFQASSAFLESNEMQSGDDGAIEDKVRSHGVDTEVPPLDSYPPENALEEWSLLYRYPDKKRKIGSRDWVNAKVEVVNGTVFVTGKTGQTEILREIHLHPYFVFTLPVLHKEKKNGCQVKIHSVKLQYVKYKERRKTTTKFRFEHFPLYTCVLKLASKDIWPLKNFVQTVENVIRKIKSHRDIGITHRHEEIFIDCDDVCQYELDGKGNVKQYNITCQIRLRAFVTGAPDLILFINDMETYKKQKNRRGNQKLPKSNKWIPLANIEYHPCVDVVTSKAEGGVVFRPPDACSFELLRFRVRSKQPPPLLFKGCIDFTSTRSLEIKAECRVNGEGKLLRYRKNCIVAKLCIPDCWSSVFVHSWSFTGKKKYLKARSNAKTLAPGIARGTSCYIEVSVGTARYEPEFNALVWRLGDLPVLEKQVPADAVQTLNCHITLPFEIDFSDKSILSVDVDFEVNQCIGSDVQIQEVLLPGKGIPDKWVCYKAAYSYKVIFDVSNEQRLALH